MYTLGVETFAWRNFRAFRGFADFAARDAKVNPREKKSSS